MSRPTARALAATAVLAVLCQTTTGMAQSPAKIVVKPASQKAEAQIARFLRWLENKNGSQTFAAQYRMKVVEKIKEAPAEAIADPIIGCLKKTANLSEFGICVRALPSSQ
jgi:hypothetical protein